MEERELNDLLGFWSDDDPRPVSEGQFAWPTDDDTLIREHVGKETWFHPIRDWVANPYERLTYYANQYHRAARDLVSQWLRGRHNPETFVYAVAFMYRQAIELRLKALVSITPGFHAKSVEDQRADIMGTEAGQGHDLDRLWNLVEDRLPLADALGEKDCANLRRLLHELSELDRKADGFRFPFEYRRVSRGQYRIEDLASELDYKSADNFVHVLEAITNCVNMIPDGLEQIEEFNREMRYAASEGWG